MGEPQCWGHGAGVWARCTTFWVGLVFETWWLHLPAYLSRRAGVVDVAGYSKTDGPQMSRSVAWVIRVA